MDLDIGAIHHQSRTHSALLDQALKFNLWTSFQIIKSPSKKTRSDCVIKTGGDFKDNLAITPCNFNSNNKKADLVAGLKGSILMQTRFN